MTRSKLAYGLAPLAWLAVGGAGPVTACSSGSDAHPPLISSGGSASSDAGSVGTGGRKIPVGTDGGSSGLGGSEAGAAGEAGEAGRPDRGADGGAAGAAGGQEQGTVVPVTPSVCSETAVWAGAAPVDAVSTDADESLLSITPDELDIVFMRLGAPFWAHRDTPSDTFGMATAVTLPAGYVASAGAALSSDGMTLVLISSNGGSFGALSRTSRTLDFGPNADTTAFVGLNQRAAQTLERYAAPVLSADGKSFVFSSFRTDAGNISVVYQALWTAPRWAMPSSISHGLFDGTGDKRPLPTGLSSDSRTLFYFDEATSKEMARFRERPDAPLYDVIDLGDRAGAIPNSTCQRIYYTNSGNVLTDAD
jgi:hypothetical protein